MKMHLCIDVELEGTEGTEGTSRDLSVLVRTCPYLSVHHPAVPKLQSFK